jgi:hypothetical protein
MKNTYIKTSMKLILILTSVSVSFNSCKKFEDGPLLSVRTKDARLSNDWILNQVLKDGVDYTSSYLNTSEYCSLILTENGTYNWYIKRDSTIVDVVTGGYTFGKKESNLNLATLFSSPERFYEGYTITRLTNKELWLKSHIINKDELEFHFTAKK